MSDETEALRAEVEALRRDAADCAENHYTCEEFEALRAELMLVRQQLFLGHGHSGPALYGDDGEMMNGFC